MHAHFRAFLDEPRPARPPARVWRDWVLVGVLAPLAVVEGIMESGPLYWRAASVVVVLTIAATLLWRRTRPLEAITAAFVSMGVLTLVSWGAAPELPASAGLLLLPYALVRWGSGREIVTGLTVMSVNVGICTVATYMNLASVFGGLVVIALPIAVGAAVRYRASARLRELDQVKLLERERLARDLHDTVAHHVSAIAIRAQAGLATSAANPVAAIEALRVIVAEASRTLAEMRAMVRVLRTELPSEPRIADLEQLATGARGGPPVDVQVRGDVEDVPPAVGATIYRLAQESVTNARRHARHATRIEVRVAADDTLVRLQVSDDGVPSDEQPAAASGYGLTGMIERAALLGGTCEAGPGPERGWTVTAVLPRIAPVT